MSVVRISVEKCVGCGLCYKICPMDVFRMNREYRKSVITFPESCISCGQCFVNCPGRSLGLSNYEHGHGITSLRLNPGEGMNNFVYIPETKDAE